MRAVLMANHFGETRHPPNPSPSFARRGPTIRGPSPPSLRSGGPPSRGRSGWHSKASFARILLFLTPTPPRTL
ncbi:hypothetical protein R3P38DRAFT_2912541, partial [Favolaschia claudopus]